MTDIELSLIIAIPTGLILMGFLMNGRQHISLSRRMTAIESRMLSVEQTVISCFDLFTSEFR